MLTPVDSRRRWFGACFLIIAGLLLAWGLTLLREWLIARPILFILYWFSCFGFTMLAFLVALLDMFIMRRRTREEQKKLFEKSFAEAQAKAKQKDFSAD